MRPLAYDLAALCAVALVAGCMWAYGPRFRLWLRAELRHRAFIKRAEAAEAEAARLRSDLARVTGGDRRG